MPCAFCFNPCFNGCSSSTYYSMMGFQLAYYVSILVLMDVPLQRDKIAGYIRWLGVSILVLMDVPLQQRLSPDNHQHPYTVSILVLMDVPLQHNCEIYI